MRVNPKKYIVTSYEMYDITGGKNVLIESTQQDQPMKLITGIGMIPLDALEEKLLSLATGDNYELGLTHEMAFGEYCPDAVIEIPKEYLSVNGRFMSEIIRPEAVIPLQNENGERVSAKVLEVGENHVKVDCNHPLAGKDLLVSGKIIESRPATDEDVMSLTMHHCGGCSGGGCCGSGCDDGGCGGCGNCQDDECQDNNCCGGGCSHCAS